MIKLCLSFVLISLSCAAGAATWQVGPSGDFSTIAEAAKRAKDGDVVEIRAGDYRGDTAVWTQKDLVIRAVGGRARLFADGKSAEGKAIWVVRSGGEVSVENIDFLDAKVRDKNGAGIRLEAGQLTVLACKFLRNENGILTANDATIRLRVENSEFAYNGEGAGSTHNLYAGSIARLEVRGSYFHHVKVGHLLKSRAAVNVIRYNRLTDETGGTGSYELEFPNGGLAIVVGNILQQSATTENATMISFGAEGIKHAGSALYLAHNTLADDRTPPGRYLDVRGDVKVRAYNNVLLGAGRWDIPPGDLGSGNVTAQVTDVMSARDHDYRLTRRSSLADQAIEIPDKLINLTGNPTEAISLQPEAEYVYPVGIRTFTQPARHPGAVQAR